jgi:ATP-binding cassette subfamily B protein
MNRSEAQANNRAIDSLINYETVKYCGNEEHEVKRYDECMHTYQVGRRVNGWGAGQKSAAGSFGLGDG